MAAAFVRSKNGRLFVALAILAGTLGLASGSTASSAATPSGKLLFCTGASAGQCSHAIYIASGDGSGVRKLTATPVTPRNLTWSPRGDRFLFTGYRLITPYGLYLGDLGGHVKQIATGYIDGFAWLPNGSSFGYVTSTSETGSGTSKLVVESAATLTQKMPLGRSACRPIDGPFISPHGTKVVYNGVGAAGCNGLDLLDLRTGKSRLIYPYNPLHRVLVVGWRNATTLVVGEGYPSSTHARLLTTSGRMSKPLIPSDPSVLLPEADTVLDRPYWSPLSADGNQALFDVQSCQSSTVCGFTTEILDLHSHKLSSFLPGSAGGWSKHGAELMSYGIDDSKTSTNLDLLSGVALDQDWTGSVPMPIGDLAWSG